MTPAILLLIAGSVFLAGVVRGMTGFGFALLAVPLFLFVLEPSDAVALAIAIQIVIGVPDILTHWRHADRQAVFRLSLGAVIGTPFGVWMLVQIDPTLARAIIAGIVAAGALALAVMRPASGSRSWKALALPSGVLGGAMGGFAAIPGPPAVGYCLLNGLAPATSRATLVMFFLAVSLIALPQLVIGNRLDTIVVMLSLGAAPLLWLGHYLGNRLVADLEPSSYRRLCIMTLAATAIIAFFQSGIRI